MKNAMFAAVMSCLSFAVAWIITGSGLPSIPQILVGITTGTIQLFITVAYFDGDK